MTETSPEAHVPSRAERNHASRTEPIRVIGGGLAGSECAYQLARLRHRVELWEMRPERTTPAHTSEHLAELVCSNSLRSDDRFHAAGLLKREMERFDSLIIKSARATAVPAGAALAVDRELFAARVTETISRCPLITVRREELRHLPEGDTVIATGPLTSDTLSAELEELLGTDSLYFFDAIAPIVDAESLDLDQMFEGSRWGKGDGADYLNAPMSSEQYDVFLDALLAAEALAPHPFEKGLFFEGCLPVEEIARRGRDSLRFGPLKPVGLWPPDGSRPHAVVQLRQENLKKTHFNLVGFQSRLRWEDQRNVFRTIPGLQNAKFVRLGQVHRNTFINAPRHLDTLYRIKHRPALRIAGQLSGVEGYLESAATGLLTALYLSLERGAGDGSHVEPLPTECALGALARHLTESDPKHFQPANINYGLFPDLGVRVRKRERRQVYAERAARSLDSWLARHPTLGVGASAERVAEPVS